MPYPYSLGYQSLTSMQRAMRLGAVSEATPYEAGLSGLTRRVSEILGDQCQDRDREPAPADAPATVADSEQV